MAQNGASSSLPARTSWRPSTPERPDFLSPDPHSAMNHREALEAAKQYHTRVQEAALRTLEIHALSEERRQVAEVQRQQEEKARIQQELFNSRKLQEQQEVLRIQALQKVEQDRLALEQKKADETVRLRALQAKTVPVPQQQQQAPSPPVVQKSPSPAPPVKAPESAAAPSAPTTQPTQVNGTQAAPFTQATQTTQPAAKAPVASTATNSSIPATQQEAIKKIHMNLKQLRKFMQQQLKTNPQLKARMGDMRREITKCIGQLTIGSGTNKKQTATIQDLLTEAREGRVQSELVDPNQFLFEPRSPLPAAGAEPDKLPSLFIYLLNILSKVMINQFINECGANPKSADPIGIIGAQMFSRPQCLWRGKSLVDILLAKFYIVCPVILGGRGNEETSEGRRAVAWKMEGRAFVSDTTHCNRMTGLGAGFAALTLRDFSRIKSGVECPLPAWHYWQAFAKIVNTPAEEICSTQLVVLKSMIDGHEYRFFRFYGHAAVAALRTALVELPKKCPEKSSAAGALVVLGEMLARDQGLPTHDG